MFLPILFTTLLSLASSQVSTHDPFYCYATDPIRPQLGMFSTLSQYDNIRGNALNTPISTCTPARFWMISRGGSRLPDAGQITTMRNFYQNLRNRVTRGIDLGRASLCRQDRESISQWVFNDSITVDRNLELTQTGFDELRNTATRFQIAFPQVLPRTYNEAQFRFRHTYRERTADSALAFASGLFGHTNIVLDDVPDLDRLLRPIDTCRLYDDWASNNGERNAFREGIEFEQMTEQINRKLGLVGSNQLSTSELMTVVDYCRFEQSIEPSRPSPWCAAFSIANQAILEYADDLSTYYSSGYGGDEALFRNMNCHSMQDLLQFLQSNRTDEHLARIFISHSTVIRLFLVTLGAFRDETPLTRHNFAQQTRRQWNSSLISSMASNFAVIQHTCTGEDNDIIVYYNERPLTIPGCEAPGWCKQQTFIRLFERFLNANCDQLYCSRN